MAPPRGRWVPLRRLIIANANECQTSGGSRRAGGWAGECTVARVRGQLPSAPGQALASRRRGRGSWAACWEYPPWEYPPLYGFCGSGGLETDERRQMFSELQELLALQERAAHAASSHL